WSGTVSGWRSCLARSLRTAVCPWSGWAVWCGGSRSCCVPESRPTRLPVRCCGCCPRRRDRPGYAAGPGEGTGASEGRERLREHPHPLRLELLGAHLVGPRRCPDRFTQLDPAPGVHLTRVRSVAGEERLLQVASAAELPGGEPGQVGHRRPQRRPAEVDHPHRALVDQPVAWLPVPMGGHQR